MKRNYMKSILCNYSFIRWNLTIIQYKIKTKICVRMVLEEKRYNINNI